MAFYLRRVIGKTEDNVEVYEYYNLYTTKGPVWVADIAEAHGFEHQWQAENLKVGDERLRTATIIERLGVRGV